VKTRAFSLSCRLRTVTVLLCGRTRAWHSLWWLAVSDEQSSASHISPIVGNSRKRTGLERLKSVVKFPMTRTPEN